MCFDGSKLKEQLEKWFPTWIFDIAILVWTKKYKSSLLIKNKPLVDFYLIELKIPTAKVSFSRNKN